MGLWRGEIFPDRLSTDAAGSAATLRPQGMQSSAPPISGPEIPASAPASAPRRAHVLGSRGLGAGFRRFLYGFIKSNSPILERPGRRRHHLAAGWGTPSSPTPNSPAKRGLLLLPSPRSRRPGRGHPGAGQRGGWGRRRGVSGCVRGRGPDAIPIRNTRCRGHPPAGSVRRAI